MCVPGARRASRAATTRLTEQILRRMRVRKPRAWGHILASAPTCSKMVLWMPRGPALAKNSSKPGWAPGPPTMCTSSALAKTKQKVKNPKMKFHRSKPPCHLLDEARRNKNMTSLVRITDPNTNTCYKRVWQRQKTSKFKFCFIPPSKIHGMRKPGTVRFARLRARHIIPFAFGY